MRFVVFMQGCPLRCRYCHNPDTWAFQQGRTLTAPELMAEISRYRSFIQKGGVTLSGGEPLAQPEFGELPRALPRGGPAHGGGYLGSRSPGTLPRAVDEADLLLLDIKALEPALCKALTAGQHRGAEFTALL
ncbi:MAG: radical SAM protein [Hydrogeniiclostridium mannosilyticum]